MKVQRISKEGVWRVFAACTERGDCHVEIFLRELGADLEANVDGMYALFDRVADQGLPRNVDLNHQLRGDIWELIKGRIRILYFCDRNRVVVCTHGVLKSSQKIRRAEIEYADDIRRSYLHARNGGTLEIL